MGKGKGESEGEGEGEGKGKGIVRPTKKPTNFGPIMEVPKSGVWRGNVKKVLQTEGEEGM